MLILFALIIRAVSLEFRGQVGSGAWRSFWDCMLWVGSFVPALLFGVVFANIFAGIAIDAQGVYHGSLVGLLNPYGLLGGVLFLLLFAMHGAIWLAIKSQGKLHDRAASLVPKLWMALLVIAVAFVVYLAAGLFGVLGWYLFRCWEYAFDEGRA